MHKYSIRMVISILVTVVASSGCATTGNLIRGYYREETIPNPKTYFSQIWATTGENIFKVSGKLKLKGSIGIHVPDYVEVTLIDKEDGVLEKKKVSYYPRSLTGKRKHREAHFVAEFNEIPPQGTLIRLSNVD